MVQPRVQQAAPRRLARHSRPAETIATAIARGGRQIIDTLPPIKLSSAASGEFWEVPVVYEDEHLLALDKPSGLLSSPDRYDPQRPNLMKLLHAGIAEGKPWARKRALAYLMNAHRLDFQTSGVLLLAKTKPVLVTLANCFGSEKVSKRYLALVEGAPPEKQFTVDAKIGPHPAQIGRMRLDPKRGKQACTDFEVLEGFNGWTLLACRPRTGRTHQIRLHGSSRGLPLVGDRLYGGGPLLLSRLKRGYRLKPNQTERPLLERVALHAEQLSLAHPVSGETLTITCPWPKDLSVAVKYLRRYATAANAGISHSV